MATAAATAASAVAALAPFEMGLECLPAKGDSRNFVIEWLVFLLYLMAMNSLAPVVVLPMACGSFD
jgi:hypothetical protein